MMNEQEAARFSRVSRWITTYKRPLLVSHTKPDGDALGCLAAMRLLLASQGIEAEVLLFDPIPPRYDLFHQFAPMAVLGRDKNESDLASYDAVVVLDTCSYSQLDPIADWLRSTSLPKLAVDHHLSRDDLADCYLVDESAAANGLILYEWAVAQQWPIERPTAVALYVGIAMDTGWFRHCNTDARVFRAAAGLVAGGVQPYELYESLFQRESAGRVRLWGAALSTLELLADGRLAVMTLSKDAIQRAEATAGDTEDIVNDPLRIATVIVSVLLVEKDDGKVRVSFRSKPPIESDLPDVDVATLAQAWGGGGHQRAAGATLEVPPARARETIIQQSTKVLHGE